MVDFLRALLFDILEYGIISCVVEFILFTVLFIMVITMVYGILETNLPLVR